VRTRFRRQYNPGKPEEKCTRPELLKFAEGVIKDQTAEIQQMEDWKKTWFRK